MSSTLTNAQTTLPTKPRRRWFQFSLRSLLIAMLTIPIGLGYLAYLRRESQRQWDAVRAIQSAEGHFGNLVDNKWNREDKLKDPPSWQRLLGIDRPSCRGVYIVVDHVNTEPIAYHLTHLRSLEYIHVWGWHVDDNDLQAISRIPHLTCLSVVSDNVSDAGVSHFAGHNLKALNIVGDNLTGRGLTVVTKLPHLRELEWSSSRSVGNDLVILRGNAQLTKVAIDGTTATDISFDHLSTCENLENITVSGPSALTGDGIKSLARLKKLKYLQFIKSPLPTDCGVAVSHLTGLEGLVWSTSMSADDLKSFASMTSLKSLWLMKTQLDSEGLRLLSALKNLENLSVRMEGLKDDDMEVLSSFSKMQSISLDQSSVTDDGVMKLAGLKKLQHLNITGTQVTLDGVSKFKKLAPNVDVRWSWRP